MGLSMKKILDEMEFDNTGNI